jgi:hypothetical protein
VAYGERPGIFEVRKLYPQISFLLLRIPQAKFLMLVGELKDKDTGKCVIISIAASWISCLFTTVIISI